jgi:PAS domain S-box-containing protein
VKDLLNRASNNETVVLEYMHCSVTGEPVPCEITITRVDYNNTSVVLVYLYDLRNLKKMEKAMLDAEQMRALIDAVPLCCTLTDKNLNVLTCNKSAVEFFKLSKKDDIQSLYDDLMPEYQPNGSNSKEAAAEAIRKAFDDGYVFLADWTHLNSDGELLPCEVTLVRVEYGGDYVIAGYNRDLRAVKEAEAKTREADEHAKLMFEYAPYVVLLWNKNFQIFDCNQEAMRVVGISNKKEYIERFLELAPEHQPNGMTSPEMVQKMISKVINETGYDRVEWVIRHSVTGEAIPFEVTLIRIKYKDDYAILTYAQDLRKLKASIAKMREADERAQIMFETAPLASFMADKDGNLVDCNQEILKMFGLPDKEFYFNTAPKLLPEYQPNGELSFDEVVRNNRIAFEKGYNRFEWEHLKLNGESLPAEVILVRVKYRGENAIAGYIRDLTEQKAAERLTKIITEKTSTLTAIFNSTPDMMFCKDSNLLFTECNKAMENYFGIRQSDIAGKPELEALNIPPEIAIPLLARDKRVIAERQAITSEELVKSYDGRMIHFEMIRAPLIQEGKVIGIVGIARDITQRKEIELLAKQQAEAEAANRAKSSFLATMSHEMRTPMNAILGVTEIQLQNEELSPDTKDALHIIYNSGYSLLGVLNNLLDLSKIEANKLELINDRYEMANLINDVVSLNITGIGSKPIEFKLHVDEDMPFELIGDELRVKQILNNLLSNAFKYTDSGEVRLSFSAQINGNENAADGNTYVTLVIDVLDTGQGMTKAQIQDMFDAYSRFNLKMNRLVEGTGLGMSIVQQLVNKMDGDIAVNSVPGKGTEVTVHLRQGYADPAKLGKELAKNLMDFRLTNTSKMKKAQILREPMPYGSVLVVDDMETNLYVAKGFLLPYGLAIDTALSGMEAIEKIEHGNEYDIVFMDHMMPKMDGVEAVQIIRKKGYTRPIVALTANAVSGQAEMFMANGFDGFISKPIDIRELNVSLNKFVRDRHTPEEVEAARAAYNGGAVVDDAVPQSDPGLAKIFVRDAEKAIAVLQGYEDRNAYGSDDLQEYIINVHALKSALANIDEAKLSGFAREMEQAGRERKIDFISEETSSFLGELRAVVDKLKPDLEEYGADDVSDEDKVYLQKMLLTVKEACAAYDKKAAKAALTELKQKPWPGIYGELLDTIAEYLLHSDFDEAEAACAAYLSSTEG